MKLLCWLLKFLLICAIAIVGGKYAAEAWIAEDAARVAKLERHFYEVALARSPLPPQNVRPNYGDLSEPKTRAFQDVSTSTGMGYDKRKAERRGR